VVVLVAAAAVTKIETVTHAIAINFLTYLKIKS
jgi:hypothetical protein